MPLLPVARVLWDPKPGLAASAEAWILAGGAHHTCFSQNITIEDLEDYSSIAGIEIVVVDENLPPIREYKQMLRNNEIYYRF
jgi:L-arabinose isomerase